MTTIHTAHGAGEVIDTITERGGRVSYKVKVGLNEIWVKASEVHGAEGGSPENLFSYQYTPDKTPLDPEAMIVGNVFAMGSKGFSPMEPAKSVRDIDRPYPYDPTPQYPVDMFNEQTIQPGENEIDPAKRLKPSQPSTQPPSPGPSPNLFATGSYSSLRQRPEIVAGKHPGDLSDDFHYGYAGQPGDWERPTPQGSDSREFPRQRKDPSKGMPRLEEDDEPVYPYDKVSPSGDPKREMGEGEDPDWYSCPDCGAWHNPFRHMHKRRGPKPPRSDDIFQPDWKSGSTLPPLLVCADCREGAGQHRAPWGSRPDERVPYYPVRDHTDPEPFPPSWRGMPSEDDESEPTPMGPRHLKGPKHRAASFADLDFPTDMPERFAYIPGPQDFENKAQLALAAIQRQAAILEGEYGLSPRTAVEMDLVEADPNVREAAWRDVQRKAKRLRSEGRVHIKDASPEHIVATVDGDTGTYDTIIVRGNVFDLGGQSVTSWHCGCDWGRWAFKRRLTYVGRFCSHAYATYQEMRSMHDVPGSSTTRTRSSGIVEDFKDWAKENDQPEDDPHSISNFYTEPERLNDEGPPTGDEVGQLYDYADDHPTMSPERNYDVPYTFEHDKVYKDAREMLRTQPQGLTPTLQFVPEGEPEHFVDLTKDERKTTGPGQIMQGGNYRSLDEQLDEDPARQREEEPEIAHFSNLQFVAEEQAVNNPTPGSPSNPRPDAGESTRDLNSLRDLIAEPLSDSFGDMDSRNDRVRDLVDDLHDGGIDASPIAASRRVAADDDPLQPSEGAGAFAGSGPDPKWWFGSSADYIDEHERPNFQDVTDLPDGDILKYNDTDGPVRAPKEPSTPPGGREAYRLADLFSNETSSMSPMGPNITTPDTGMVNSGDPLMSPGDNVTGGEDESTGTLASLLFHADGMGDDTAGTGEFGGLGGAGFPGPSNPGTSAGGGGGMGMGGMDPILPPGGSGSHMAPPHPSAGAGAGDFTVGPGSSQGLSGGAGGADFAPMGPGAGGGAGSGDFVQPGGTDKLMSAGVRPSIRDSIERRNGHWQQRQRHAFDPSTMPPGWGSNPANPDDDEDPLPPIPGQKAWEDAMPSMNNIPGMPGGKGKGGPGGMPKGMPEIPEIPPVVASTYDPRWDQSDIVAQFHQTAGAQGLHGRGMGMGGGEQPAGARSAAMGQWGASGASGSRGRFSDGDIAGAAAGFLQRTAGRTYTMAQQQDLVNEEPVNGRGARNLGGLDLSGTHYVQ